MMAWLQPDRSLRTRVWKRWTVPWDRAHVAFVLLLALGALVPLAVLHQRSGTVRDPFGYEWNIGHHIEEVTPEEMQRRYDAGADG